MLYELRVTGLLYDNKIEWLLKIKEKLDSVGAFQKDIGVAHVRL